MLGWERGERRPTRKGLGGHVECSAGSEGSDGISEKGLGGGGYMSTLCLGWRAERPAWVGRATDGWPTELEKG